MTHCKIALNFLHLFDYILYKILHLCVFTYTPSIIYNHIIQDSILRIVSSIGSESPQKNSIYLGQNHLKIDFVKTNFPNLNILNCLIAKLILILANQNAKKFWEISLDEINLQMIPPIYILRGVFCLWNFFIYNNNILYVLPLEQINKTPPRPYYISMTFTYHKFFEVCCFSKVERRDCYLLVYDVRAFCNFWCFKNQQTISSFFTS